jgi:cytochrome d ubiquinol oxidase subunit I
MQYPIGMEFNPDTVRNEMVDFWAILGSPVAINKFFHTVVSCWIVGSMFVLGVSAWFLLKKREVDFAIKSLWVASIFGVVSSILLIWTGDGSAYHVSQRQPMKLAVMEGLYEGSTNANLLAFGVLNPEKEYNDTKDPYLFSMDVPIPGLLSFLGYRDFDAFVPGVKDIIDGGYETPTGTALSFTEKQSRGKKAHVALEGYTAAMNEKDTVTAQTFKASLTENYPYFGYGYLDKPEDLIPNIPMVFYAFHIMVMLGMYFLALFVLVLFLLYRKKMEKARFVSWIVLWSIPLAYVASQVGWIVAEVGRQPWAIQDILPVQASISSISAESVKLTFFLFLVLFSALLIAEVKIMLKQIKKGPENS